MSRETRGSGSATVYYVVGQKSKGYRLRAALRHARHHRLLLGNDHLAARIRAWQDHRDWLPVHYALFEQLRRVEIDAPGAIRWTKRRYSRLMRSLSQKPHNCWRHRRKAVRSRNQRLHSIELLADKQFKLSVDDYGRVHTNLTGLSRHLRRFLSLGGQALAEVDIVNSQPLIFGLLLMEWYENDKQGFGLSPNKLSPRDVLQAKNWSPGKEFTEANPKVPNCPFAEGLGGYPEFSARSV